MIMQRRQQGWVTGGVSIDIGQVLVRCCRTYDRTLPDYCGFNPVRFSYQRQVLSWCAIEGRQQLLPQ